MNKTLITGTNGFLANRMLDFVDGEKFGISRANNYKVKEQKCNVLYGDILDLEFLKRVISDFEIDTIYVIEIATQLGILEKRDELYSFAHQAYQDYYHAQEEKAILGL